MATTTYECVIIPCVAVAPIDCDDGKECTRDSCDPDVPGGCINGMSSPIRTMLLPFNVVHNVILTLEDITGECDDRNACTRDICLEPSGCENSTWISETLLCCQFRLLHQLASRIPAPFAVIEKKDVFT